LTKKDDKLPLRALAKGFRGRTLKSVRLASKVGTTFLKKTASIGDAVKLIDEDEAVAAASRLLEELDGLKGLMMKFGQMASYLNHTLPPKAQRILAKLQAESQPMAFDCIAEVVVEELGGQPKEVFDSFEETPFAAASIGQVHRATFEGQEVAVKVQYPEIRDLLRGDLKTVNRFARLMTLMSPLNGKALAKELQERVLTECDYRAEADNQRLFTRLLAGNEMINVPRVVADRSAGRVLTSELAPGQGYYPFVDTADQEAKDRAGHLIFETCFKCIFHYCVFNADPHPGNYLFAESGAVTFLDFGCIKHFDTTFIDSWKALALCILDGDRKSFPERFSATGLVGRHRKFDWDAQWDCMNYVYQPFKEGRVAYTHEYVQGFSDELMWKNPNKFKLNMPPDWLFINRLQWGLISVLAGLKATANWGELFRAAVESKTEPQL